MPQYCFYLLDKDENPIEPPHLAHCADDDAALLFALQFNGEHTIEIWNDNRHVTVIPADS